MFCYVINLLMSEIRKDLWRLASSLVVVITGLFVVI